MRQGKRSGKRPGTGPHADAAGWRELEPGCSRTRTQKATRRQIGAWEAREAPIDAREAPMEAREAGRPQAVIVKQAARGIVYATNVAR